MIHSGGCIGKIGQCVDRGVALLLRGGGCLDPFVCGGDLRGGGQNIPGLGWCNIQEFEFYPVVPVEQEFPGGYIVSRGWTVLLE